MIDPGPCWDHGRVHRFAGQAEVVAASVFRASRVPNAVMYPRGVEHWWGTRRPRRIEVGELADLLVEQCRELVGLVRLGKKSDNVGRSLKPASESNLPVPLNHCTPWRAHCFVFILLAYFSGHYCGSRE